MIDWDTYDWNIYGWHIVKKIEMRKTLEFLSLEPTDPKLLEAIQTLKDLPPTQENLELLQKSETELKMVTDMIYTKFTNLMYVNAAREGLLEIEKRLDDLEDSLKHRYP